MGKYKVKLDFFKLLKREIRIMLKNFSIIYSFSTFFVIASLIFVFSVDDISYWTISLLNELIFPLFNPENAFTLIAEPEK